MNEIRSALYRGFMVIIRQDGMKAYRNPEYFSNNISSYEVPQDTDISFVIDEAEDDGDFSLDMFNEVAGESQYLGMTDVCIGCGQEFPVEMLLYEGVEPLVFAPRCNICTIKNVQDIAGAENVILPEKWRN